MTERDFWIFLNSALSKGRAMLASGSIDSGGGSVKDAVKYVGGHSLLPDDYDKIPISTLNEMAPLLNSKSASLHTKEAILVLLAYHPTTDALRILEEYNRNPDRELRIYAELALDECRMWNE